MISLFVVAIDTYLSTGMSCSLSEKTELPISEPHKFMASTLTGA